MTPSPDFHLLFERGPAMYLALLPDADFTIVAVSDSYLRATRTSREDILGRPLFEVFPDNPADAHADGVKNVRASLLRALAGKAPDAMPIQRYDIRVPQAEGGGFEERYWSAVSTPIVSPEGSVRYLLYQADDVTQVVRAARRGEEERGALKAFQQAAQTMQALRENQQQFRSLADSIPQLAWIAEADGSIHWYNQRWYDYTGTTLADMEADGGWGWTKVHDPRELPRVIENFKAAIASGQPWEDTFPLRRGNGEFRWHLSRAMPVKDAAGRVVRWFGTNTDVEDQRRQATELREAVQARDIFLSVASHELKTPLTPLKLRLAQLTRQTNDERALRHLEVAERQVKRIALLVEQMLDVSRLAEGWLSLSLEEVDVADVIRETVSLMEAEATKAGSVILVGPLVEAAGRFDRMRLGLVVTNLLANAIKFGAGKPVHVDLTTGNGKVRLVVRDEGIGIAPENLERIFGRFERAVSERNYGGLGLGLWVARQVVGAMGGQVKVESVLGEGARFTVELPL